jgi:protein-tyrosine phosphatase
MQDTISAIAAEDALAEATLERLVPLQGGLNFRDLGGYRTADGRRVRRGKLFRSGSLSKFTDEDCAYVAGLGLKTLIDLRTTDERTREPNLWVEAAPLTYWTRDYDMSFGELRRVMELDLHNPEHARKAMTALYEQLPFEQAPAYRELFQRIADGEIPMVFHCAAGKDRAGTAAALILSALGVPRETVMADYLLSDHLVERRREAHERAGGSLNPIAQLPPDVVRAILGADASYLEAGFAAIEARHGSLTGYLADELGVAEPMLAEIRGRLVE